MSEFFFRIVTEAVNYDDKASLKAMYALRFEDLQQWCEEMLDREGVPEGAFRTAFLDEMFYETGKAQDLFEFIQSKCVPDAEEEGEEAEDEDCCE